MKHRSAILTRLFLFAFLFAVQSLCFAHQVDHIANSEAETCAVCVAGAHLGHAIADSTPEPIKAVTGPVFETAPANSVETRTLPSRRARAPPLS